MVPIPMYTKASFRGNGVPICFPEKPASEPLSLRAAQGLLERKHRLE
jgi:hypothetical protein